MISRCWAQSYVAAGGETRAIVELRAPHLLDDGADRGAVGPQLVADGEEGLQVLGAVLVVGAHGGGLSVAGGVKESAGERHEPAALGQT